MTDDSGEVRIKNETTGGEKGQKTARFDLLPAGPLHAIATHYGIGARKYSDRNWEKGYDWSLSYGAMQRHLNAFWGGEDIDEETQSPHLAAAGFHMLALLEFANTHPELDDRPATKARLEALRPLMIHVESMVQSWGLNGILRSDVVEFFEPEPEPEPDSGFKVGDRVQHDSGICGTISQIGGVVMPCWGDLVVDWEDGWTQGTLFGSIRLVDPKPTGRVSVRKITEALDGMIVWTETAPGDVQPYRLDADNRDTVAFLDALEEAGYEVTYQQ